MCIRVLGYEEARLTERLIEMSQMWPALVGRFTAYLSFSTSKHESHLHLTMQMGFGRNDRRNVETPSILAIGSGKYEKGLFKKMMFRIFGGFSGVLWGKSGLFFHLVNL